jgi:predicted kinase
MKAYITIGLPASGKSTWAKNFVRENPNTIRINNDDIRNAIYRSIFESDEDRVWSPEIESRVRAERSEAILLAYEAGRDIIIDNTHCNSKPLRATQEECRNLGFEIEIKDFRHVTAEECIRRDSLREGHERVGEEVIRRMEKLLLAEKPKQKRERKTSKYADSLPDLEDTGKPKCIIVDADGTIFARVNRSPYDETKVYDDVTRNFVVGTVDMFVQADEFAQVFIFSGRSEACRADTVKWLNDKCGWRVDSDTKVKLFMRGANDRRRDSLVKLDLYNEHVKDKFDVVAVFDDRAQVIRECWKPLGLPVFRCGLIDEDEF